MKKLVIVTVALLCSFLSASNSFCVPDTIPDPFTFTDRTNVALSTEYKSNAITVSGINAAAPISIVSGTYSINGAAYTSASGTVTVGNTVKVRKVSAATYSTTKSATLTIGGVSDTFSVTTHSATTPDPFTFTDRTNVALSTEYESNAITVSGINAAAPISIVGGTYSINGAAYTSASSTVSLGNTVKVRKVSAAAYSTTKSATLTIGGVSDTFSVTTLASYTVCDSGHGCSYTNIASAISALTNGTANTITVKSPYAANERVTVNKAGASNSSRVVIIADIGYTPVTKGFNVTSAYVTVNGFEMTGCGADFCASWSADYVSFLNNNIHGTGTSDFMYGQTSDNYVNYAVFSGNKVHDGSAHYVAYTWCNYCTFDSNEIYNFVDADNLYFWGHDSVFSNNYVHDISYGNGVNHSDGFQTFGQGGASVVAYNWVFEKNLFVSTGQDLQPFNLQNDANVNVHDLTIRNNIFMNYGTQGNIGVPDTKVYNNTFINVGANNQVSIALYYSALNQGEAWDCTGVSIKNNLFINTFNSDPIAPDDGNHCQAITTRDYNYAVRTSGGTYHAIGGGAFEWPFWGETHGINSGANPLFLNWMIGTVTCGTYNSTIHSCSNFDLRLQSGSPAINVGADLSGTWANATDKDGVVRPQGAAWDIGAYEYNTSGTVSLGNTVKVRKMSASAYSTTKSATLTIGGVSDTFSVTTMDAP